MKTALAMLILAASVPAAADSGQPLDRPGNEELEPYIQCAPYARQVSGIQLFGEARTWWEQAQGRYATGSRPKPGAVMAFHPHRGMQSGHVATVSRVLDSRRVLLDHANWSPVDGRRGQVEREVLAIDASPSNDWSEVQVWYAPLGKVGTTRWPIDGFIYADGSPQIAAQIAVAPQRAKASKRFARAFADFAE